MTRGSRVLTLDSNVLIASLKKDEHHSERCAEVLRKVPGTFLLSEPSIVYQEVCGTLARRVGAAAADKARRQLDLIIHSKLLINCDRTFCISAYPLCFKYNVNAIDAMYLKVALDTNAVLVSLDKEDFIDKIAAKELNIETYHVSEFPY